MKYSLPWNIKYVNVIENFAGIDQGITQSLHKELSRRDGI